VACASLIILLIVAIFACVLFSLFNIIYYFISVTIFFIMPLFAIVMTLDIKLSLSFKWLANYTVIFPKWVFFIAVVIIYHNFPTCITGIVFDFYHVVKQSFPYKTKLRFCSALHLLKECLRYAIKMLLAQRSAFSRNRRPFKTSNSANRALTLSFYTKYLSPLKAFMLRFVFSIVIYTLTHTAICMCEKQYFTTLCKPKRFGELIKIILIWIY